MNDIAYLMDTFYARQRIQVILELARRYERASNHKMVAIAMQLILDIQEEINE